MGIIIILCLFFVLLPIGLSIAAWRRLGETRQSISALGLRMNALERELGRQNGHAAAPSEAPTQVKRDRVPSEPAAAAKVAPAPPPLPALDPVSAAHFSAAPPCAVEAAKVRRQAEPAPFDWERFMGAKLFAWIGGLALFLGVAFFVKYSFEHNLIPPAVRVTIGFAIGGALIAGGLKTKREALAVTAQTLCATGVLILYATTFACRALYHFTFFGPFATLVLMSTISALAFGLAVRLDAPVVAVLGMFGGFLTPPLLATGEDNPFALFSYIALLDAGLLAVALHRRWHYLAPLGAAGTALTQVGWAEQFFVAGRYFEGNRVLVPMAVLAGFVAMFVAATGLAKRFGRMNGALAWSALGLSGVACCFVIGFLAFPTLAHRPLLVFGFVFLVDLGVLGLALLEQKLGVAQSVSGLIVFALLAAWTNASLEDALLCSGLALYFVFAAFHSLAPIVLARVRPAAAPVWWSQCFPPLALLIVLLPVLHLESLSFAVWPFVFLVDVLALVVVVGFGSLVSLVFALLLTLGVTAAWITRIPEDLTGLPTSLWMLGAFAVFFVMGSVWAARRLAQRPATGANATPLSAFAVHPAVPKELETLLPACAVVLPFLLLIMAVERLRLSNPSPVFAVALMLVVLVLGLSRFLAVDLLPLVGLGSALALEHAWHHARFDGVQAAVPLVWNLVFYSVFSAFPFVFRKGFAGRTLPWAAAALAGPLHFGLVHQLVRSAWPNPVMGLLPAAFAVPALLGLAILARTTPAESPARQTQLAWFGGAALFFLTLIVPIQFEREWVTIGWALEGAALCWLCHRVTHPGLRLVGVALLIAAFARLALNPAVLDYHPRSAVAIVNWYLYAYAIVAACQFAAARLLAPPRQFVLECNVRPLLFSMGTLLIFLLVNLEIADYFTAPGAPVVTLEFSGNLARDMSYSIAWALFALALLVIGFRQRAAPVRRAGIGLLSLTLLKLFLHDLATLDALYRIGALIIVAIVAILASFLYQRFLASAAGDAGEQAHVP